MKRISLIPALLAGGLALAGCGGGEAQAPAPAQPRRSVVTQLAKPELLELKVKLPVLLKPFEEVQLRATAGGTLLALPWEEGALVPASAVPEGSWLDADEFVQQEKTAGRAPTEDEIVLRNLRHLAGVKPFARVDDRQLVQSFREAQLQYDAAVRALHRTQRYPDSTEAQIDQARTARDATRAACERLRGLLRDCYVCSPVAGVLTVRERRSGEFVAPGELLGTVVVLDPLVAELHVPEADRHAVRVGDRLTIEFASIKDTAGKPVTREAVVTLLDDVAHPSTHTFRAEAQIANADRGLPAGIFGTTQVVTYRRADALVVPPTALRLRGDRISLFVVQEDGRARELADVKLGRMSPEWVELLEGGPKAGERVVVVGAALLTDGDEVAIQPDPTRSADKGEK